VRPSGWDNNDGASHVELAPSTTHRRFLLRRFFGFFDAADLLAARFPSVSGSMPGHKARM